MRLGPDEAGHVAEGDVALKKSLGEFQIRLNFRLHRRKQCIRIVGLQAVRLDQSRGETGSILGLVLCAASPKWPVAG